MVGLILMAAALAAQAAAGERKRLDELCPKLGAAERQKIERAEKDRSVYFGLIWYAREECVTEHRLGHALGTLDEVRRQAAPVDAAFDRASSRTGKPLSRRIVGVR